MAHHGEGMVPPTVGHTVVGGALVGGAPVDGEEVVDPEEAVDLAPEPLQVQHIAMKLLTLSLGTLLVTSGHFDISFFMQVLVAPADASSCIPSHREL